VIPGEVHVLDIESPVINSVSLSSSKPLTGDSIVMTVNVTDNIGVSSVKANNIPLLYQGGNIWKGNFTALEGTHTVDISAVDGTGNIVWNNSTSYKASTPDTKPPSSITNLQSTNGTTWIKWTWIKPKDTDFNLTQIYLNGIFQTSTAVEYFNSTGLEPETIYAIGTRTVDDSGNINQTWVNASAKTASLPDTTSPLIKSVLLLLTSTLTGSSINVTVNVTDNIGVSGAKANGIALHTQGGNIWKGNFTALEGTHTVNVSAVDGAGNVAWNNSTAYTATPASVTLKINDFTANVTSGKAPLETEFLSDVTSTNIIKWRWDFEPSGKDTYSQHAVTAKHTFTKPGIYDITLTVWDAAGQTATLTKSAYIVVKPAETVKKPIANFGVSVTSGKAPLTVKFTDKSINNPTSWKWNFGDGTSSTDKNPSHIYKKKGKYTVSLTVKNNAGSYTAAKSGLVAVK
jgi:PKD repeat protein